MHAIAATRCALVYRAWHSKPNVSINAAAYSFLGSRVYVAGEMQYLSEGGPRQPRIASIKATTVEPIAKNRRDEDEERMAENA